MATIWLLTEGKAWDPVKRNTRVIAFFSSPETAYAARDSRWRVVNQSWSATEGSAEGMGGSDANLPYVTEVSLDDLVEYPLFLHVRRVPPRSATKMGLKSRQTFVEFRQSPGEVPDLTNIEEGRDWLRRRGYMEIYGRGYSYLEAVLATEKIMEQLRQFIEAEFPPAQKKRLKEIFVAEGLPGDGPVFGPEDEPEDPA